MVKEAWFGEELELGFQEIKEKGQIINSSFSSSIV
jgi:hypothetical protein